MQNSMIIRRQLDGFDIRAEATYSAADDGWTCRVREGRGAWLETRGPDETGNDLMATLLDMIDLALDDAHRREAANAGPFSTAQSARRP